MKVFVYAHDEETLKALCSGARAFGDVAAFVVASGAQAPAESIADEIYLIDLPAGARPEDAAATMAKTIEAEGSALFLVEATRRGKFIAGTVSALLGTSAISDASSLTADLQAERMVFGGAAFATQRSLGAFTVVICAANALPEGECSGANEVHEVAFAEPSAKIECRSTTPREKASVNLPAASRVVGIGRGVTAQEDLELIRAFADAIDAQIGCTRPIAEEEKWLPREVYIGVSGVTIAPELYVAIGISGQVQHTVGVNQAKNIVAINKDGNAPIFKQSDLGIVGDWKSVIQGVLESL